MTVNAERGQVKNNYFLYLLHISQFTMPQNSKLPQKTSSLSEIQPFWIFIFSDFLSPLLTASAYPHNFSLSWRV